jgi:hypothetical protein
MMATYIPANINHDVLIRLTDTGREYLRQHDQAWRLTPGFSSAEAPDGWSRWQLWELMQVFGPALYLGGAPPFETAIKIEVSEKLMAVK